jgi:hypothetical protein
MREILDELSHINWPLWSDNMRDLARQQYLSGQLPLDQFLALEGSLAKPGAANVARVWMPILQDAYLGRGVMRPVPLTNFGSINPTSFANYLSDGARRVRLLTRFGPEFARLVPVDLVTRMAIQNASFSANNTTVSSWINRVLTEVNRAARNNVRIGQRVVELSNQRGGRFPDYKKWRAIRHIQGNPTNFDAARGYDDYKMQKLIYMLWHAGL